MSHFGNKLIITIFSLILWGTQTLAYGEEKALSVSVGEEGEVAEFYKEFDRLGAENQCAQQIAFTESKIKENPSLLVFGYSVLAQLGGECLSKSQRSKYEILAASQDNKESAEAAFDLARNSIDKNCSKSKALFWLEKAVKNDVEYKTTLVLANLYHSSPSYGYDEEGNRVDWSILDKCVVKSDVKAQSLYSDYFKFKNPNNKCDIKYFSENISEENEFLETQRAEEFAHDAYQFALLLKGEQKECYMNIAELNGSLAAKLFNIKKKPYKLSDEYLGELVKISNLYGDEQTFDSDYSAISEATKLIEAAKKKIAQHQKEETRRVREAEVKQRRDYPYTAMISCGFRGQNVPVMACFDKTDLKVSYNNRSAIYGMYDFATDKVGSTDSRGFVNINLPKHFRLVAQNSHPSLILSVKIRDSKGAIVFEDQASQWGVVNIGN
ncbi:MAG: hypothetical protein KBD03_02815 [Gammaproteobacteria bacterium]|nr:hypothetical protein [Gammaproteobacteria bacterium]